ncbi:MAG TPA: hypothetical protein VGC09_18440 [Rhodopila sp.]
MLSTTIALLVAVSGALPAGPGRSDNSQVLRVRLDSAHTLFSPNAPDPGRAGQLFELPQGGVGVTTGGTAQYQTFGTPGGGGVAVPNGNGTASVIGSGGRAGIARTTD